MIFQRKIDKALGRLHEESDSRSAENGAESGMGHKQEIPELEKNDFLAMVIAAMITIVPVAMITLGVFILLGYFTFSR